MIRPFRARLPWIGLLIATLWAVFWALILVLEAFAPGSEEEIAEGDEWEAVAVGVLAVAALVAVGLSWRRRGLLIPLMVAVGLFGVTVGVATAGHNHWIAALVAGGPYLLAALLTALGRSTAAADVPSGTNAAS